MEITRQGATHGTVTVSRLAGDPPIRRSTGWAGNPDSQFWHEVKRELNRRGDFGHLIKRRLQSDGHLMGDETTQHLRSPSGVIAKGGGVLIYDGDYMLRLAHKDYNAGRPVVLTYESSATE